MQKYVNCPYFSGFFCRTHRERGGRAHLLLTINCISIVWSNAGDEDGDDGRIIGTRLGQVHSGGPPAICRIPEPSVSSGARNNAEAVKSYGYGGSSGEDKLKCQILARLESGYNEAESHGKLYYRLVVLLLGSVSERRILPTIIPVHVVPRAFTWLLLLDCTCCLTIPAERTKDEIKDRSISNHFAGPPLR